MLNSKPSDSMFLPCDVQIRIRAAPLCKHGPAVTISLLIQKREGNGKVFLKEMVITYNAQFICNYQTLQAG